MVAASPSPPSGVRAPPLIVVMGVSGCGKTTLGRELAAALEAPFQEGDALHPPENVAKMEAGQPLSDADRAPWLDRVADWIARRDTAETGGVISCSALKQAYRDRLRAAAPGLAFVFPDPDPARLRERVANRRGHYMPPALLDSQLAVLERPGPDEADVLRLPGERSPQGACAAALAWLRARASAGD